MKPPEVDRAAGSRAAVAARRARAEVKRQVGARERTALDVAEAAWAGEPTAPEATLRVTELLRSIPGLGPTRAARVMHDLRIADAKRVGGLGVRQRADLREWLARRESRGATHRSRLVVLAGPTAVGKGTVSRHIREEYPDVLLSVSATTRPPRPGEVEGEHYYFVSDAEFDAMIARGEFLEHAVVHNRSRYGTPRPPIDRALAEGRSVLLEIDLQGARSVKERMPEALLVFLLPPTGGARAPAHRSRHRELRRAGPPTRDREGRAGRPGRVRRESRQPRCRPSGPRGRRIAGCAWNRALRI